MNSSSTHTDPIVSHAFREALAIGGICLIAGIWTVGYCYYDGYYRPAGDLPLVAGMPRWVFWGILFPWLTCAAISTGFAFCYMKDADLGAEEASTDDVQAAIDFAAENEGADHA